MIELSREQVLERFVEWAKPRTNIRALAVVGSGARRDHPADVWADLDLVVVATNPQFYLGSLGWLESIGKPWITTVERNAAGDIVERRVLFEGGLDVDLFILAAENADQAILCPPISEIAQRGVEVRLDRDGIFASLTPRTPTHPRPTPAAFLEVVNDFWFHAVWTAKKLRRGEIWVAKSCCDVYMKRLLLRMVEWHAAAAANWELDTWYNGRFLEQWASPRVVRELREVFAHYDREDVWRALSATSELFHWMAQETAEHLAYLYPASSGQSVAAWVARCHAEGPGVGGDGGIASC